MPICILPSNLKVCCFYDSKDTPYYSLANYSRHQVTIDDGLLGKNITWPTTEHYFQAQKITDKNERQKFYNEMKNKTANECRKAMLRGKEKYTPIDPNWDNNKVQVMLKALRAKYEQCADVKRLIDATGDMPIVEDTAGANYTDNEWGCGYKGAGRNLLGVLWMQVRTQMRDKKSPDEAKKEANRLQELVKRSLVDIGDRSPKNKGENGTLLQEHPKVIVDKKFSVKNIMLPNKEVKRKEIKKEVPKVSNLVQSQKMQPGYENLKKENQERREQIDIVTNLKGGIKSIKKHLELESNKKKYGIKDVKIQEKGKSLELQMENKSKTYVRENKKGVTTYSISKNDTRNLKSICQLAVDTAGPNAVFDLSDTPPQLKNSVREFLETAINNNEKFKNNKPEIKDLSSNKQRQAKKL